MGAFRRDSKPCNPVRCSFMEVVVRESYSRRISSASPALKEFRIQNTEEEDSNRVYIDWLKQSGSGR